ncbi:hypothetical protein N7492_001698 [Penicillium capsulatum]|uniref:Uncharacterized protein n=1 Tax=Penicillium capsulatum TaxID=69766 RepID=A0A9W9IU49_9EURO|nr:hypothetical protein N7492_001698 [Penicillium capsulatum]KAJ6129250.1 hypothetical protein N7512_002030 [Penicillium capsulatum]
MPQARVCQPGPKGARPPDAGHQPEPRQSILQPITGPWYTNIFWWPNAAPNTQQMHPFYKWLTGFYPSYFQRAISIQSRPRFPDGLRGPIIAPHRARFPARVRNSDEKVRGK